MYFNNTLESHDDDSSSDLVPNDGRIHIYAWIIAGCFTLWSCLLSFHLIYKHFRNYTQPKLQRYIVRILLMVPIYSVDSFLSLLFRKYALIFDLCRDCYEAYVLWLFFTLLVHYFDGQEHLVDILNRKPSLKHPFPTCFFPRIKLGERFLNWCRLCVLQFTIIKPLTTLTALIFNFGFKDDMYGDGQITNPKHAYLWLTLIENVSITISMYFLVLFYMATKEELKPFKPVPKFLCIKAIIFFSFWQGVVISIIAMTKLLHNQGTWTKDQIATGAQDFLICLEMFAVAIAHISVFGYEQFRNPNKTPFIKSILSGKVKESTLPLLRNFSDAINPKYDIETTRHVLNNAPIFSMQSPFLDEKKRKIVSAVESKFSKSESVIYISDDEGQEQKGYSTPSSEPLVELP